MVDIYPKAGVVLALSEDASTIGHEVAIRWCTYAIKLGRLYSGKPELIRVGMRHIKSSWSIVQTNGSTMLLSVDS